MPRQARLHGETGVYHILFQGPPGRPPFWEAADRSAFADLIREKRSGGEYFLYAYCILPDRAQFVIREGRAGLERITKRLGISYARYYQRKYSWQGKVFHDRFKSQPLKDDGMLRAAIRYVHGLNGANALSSVGLYRDLLEGMLVLPGIFSLFEGEADPFAAAAELAEPAEAAAGDCFLTVPDPFALQEAEAAARWRMQQFLAERQMTMLQLKQRQCRQERRQILELLADDERLSGRHLARITGLNRETVRLELNEILNGERNA